jgi:predicted nucleic acid-binding protein
MATTAGRQTDGTCRGVTPETRQGRTGSLLLAEEFHGVLLVDDPAARQEAARRHLAVLGSLSILRTAKLRGLIPEVTSHLNALRATGFRIRDELSTRCLRDMGEA